MQGFSIFLFIGGVFALFCAIFLEESRPWEFLISGSCFSILFGYFGITGRTPSWLQKGENMKKHNPHLKAAFLEAVENQLADNDPLETKETLDRLVKQGISEEDAKLYIAQAVCVEVFDVMKHQKEFDLDRYVKNLKRLPDEPES